MFALCPVLAGKQRRRETLKPTALLLPIRHNNIWQQVENNDDVFPWKRGNPHPQPRTSKRVTVAQIGADGLLVGGFT